jgi:hypothetical protein
MKNKGDIMKKKNIIIIILSVILVCAICAVAYLAFSGKEEVQTTTSNNTSTIQTTAVQTTVDVSETSTELPQTESTTEDKYPFIRNGVWYLVDEKNEECYAFSFKKNNSADIAYFNTENIEGLDAQYFKGDAKYKIGDNKIVLSNLPEEFTKKSITFEIKDNSILFEGKKIKHYDKISLDNALKCFE